MSAIPDESLALDNFFSASLTSDITSSSTDIPMDSIPNAAQGFLVIDPDSTSNREIIFYNSKTSLKVTVPSVADGRGQGSTTAAAHTSGTTVIMAYVNNILSALQSMQAMTLDAKGGWVSALGESESWTYSSYDSTNKTGVITVPSDATTQFSVGMRVRFTNNSSVQYGIITKLTSTTLTVYFGTDYSLTNSAITVPYYSVHKAPLGFPLDPAKWTVSVTSSATTALTGSWSNAGAINLSIPIGAWKIFGNATANSTRTGATASEVSCMLSESATAVTTGYETTIDTMNTGGASGSIIAGMTFRPNIDKTFTTATTVYLDFITVATTGNLYVARGNVHGIRAVCAYL